MIYFDNNATTPVVPEVFDAINRALGSYANPSSGHSLASESREIVERARESVADLLGARLPEEIVFTSGGTESDNWAILGALRAAPEKDHIITTRVEHEAVRKLCQNLEADDYHMTWIDVDEDGSLDIDTLGSALDETTAIVSVMLANNETGILFPVEEIGNIVKERSKAIFHVDGVNAVGKVPIDLKNTEIDLFSLSAHKFHGPKGIGALYVREGVHLPSFFIGGGQEQGRRAGTEAVHQIAGLGAAARYVKDMTPMKKVRELRDRLETEIMINIPNSRLNGTSDIAKRLPNTSNISFENTNGEMIMHKLDELGICVSTGSACHSEDHSASPVLQAMDVPYSYAMGSIRFSLGRFNTDVEIDALFDALPGIIDELQTRNS
jgi:cysteine desulfurase